MTKLRVLIAFDDAHRIYGETIAGAIEAMRPAVEATTTKLSGFETEGRIFEPHVVISSLPRVVANPIGPLAWVQIPIFTHQRARIWLEERRWEASNLPLEEILSVVDEAEKLVRDQDL
jgi:hypothetical protein